MVMDKKRNTSAATTFDLRIRGRVIYGQQSNLIIFLLIETIKEAYVRVGTICFPGNDSTQNIERKHFHGLIATISGPSVETCSCGK
jgi:hypothetical protein